MTQEQIELYGKLSKEKESFEKFIDCLDNEGYDVSAALYTIYLCRDIVFKVKNEAFKKEVCDIARKYLKNINKQIEEL